MKYEKCNVVMLPTEKASPIWTFKDGVPQLSKGVTLGYGDKYRHLYILSNEDIKEGDWYLDKYNQIWRYSNGKLRSCDKLGIERFTTDNIEGQGVKKIIATTDESLRFGEDVPGFVKYKSLPRPSNEFLKKYCELGGIDEVLVEYEEVNVVKLTKELFDQIGNHTSMSDYPIDRKEIGKLKVSPDNTITIKPIKDSWSREEVIELIRQYNAHIFNTNDEALGPYQFNHWIKQNL